MLIDILILIIAAMTVGHIYKYGLISSMPQTIFISITVLYALLVNLYQYDNQFHYILGAFMALVIGALISLCKRSKIAGELQFICVLDIIINSFGCFLYEVSMSVDIHYIMGIGLYLWTLWVLKNHKGIRYGDTNMDRGNSFFLGNFIEGCSNILRIKKQV